MKKKDLIVVRGAGDLATGTIHRLKKAGFRLLVLEAEHPAAIRRQVALSEAVYAGSARVEDVEAVRMDVDLAEKKNRKELLEQEMERIWKKDGVPVLVDPAGLSIAALRPAVVVDALQEFFSLRGQYRLAAVAAAPVALYQRDAKILLGAL